MTGRPLGGALPPAPLELSPLSKTLKAKNSNRSVKAVVIFSPLIDPGVLPQLSEAFLWRLGAVFAQAQFSPRYAEQCFPSGEISALTLTILPKVLTPLKPRIFQATALGFWLRFS